MIKKPILFSIALIAFMAPSFAQSHDYNANDREPYVLTRILKDQIPDAVLKAASVQFNRNDPQTWSRFPYALKEYGWVYDIGAEDITLDRYEVAMKTDKGDDFKAIYTNKGELIETSETAKNIPIPPGVMEEFKMCKYKDWKIIGNREIIRLYHDHNSSSVEQHFRITVKKNGIKRNISLNWQVIN
jgi:hypothetical protein